MNEIHFLWKIRSHFFLQKDSVIQHEKCTTMLMASHENSNSGNQYLIQPAARFQTIRRHQIIRSKTQTESNLHHFHINVAKFCKVRMLELNCLLRCFDIGEIYKKSHLHSNFPSRSTMMSNMYLRQTCYANRGRVEIIKQFRDWSTHVNEKQILLKLQVGGWNDVEKPPTSHKDSLVVEVASRWVKRRRKATNEL